MQHTETTSSHIAEYNSGQEEQWQLKESGIVHDLGNLIQVASSALSLVTRDASVMATPALQPLLIGASTALQRAGVLVRETLTRNRCEPCKLELTDVAECLREISALVKGACDSTVVVEIHAGNNLPAVSCDHQALQNAILNLVFNARDAMPDGGLITIDAALGAPTSDAQVELTVRDTGVGMSSETARRAFDLFFTTKGNGIGGVGLAMVKHFVDTCGGRVDIDSRLGTGTIVILRLPVARPEFNGTRL
ncbi:MULTISPECIES: HAMP domain-containing sensor histidine kinase [Kaistia]|uniref:histidine kinase n=1 Tax=Kaistia defluvii TaxID=410841 RepID=A0ABV2R5S0_9HYPH